MKKRSTFLMGLVLVGFSAFSQITLTSATHGLKAGDAQIMLKAEYIEPGPGGARQIWNFSGLKLYGQEETFMLDATKVEKYGAMPSATVAMTTGSDFHGMYRITATENDNVGHFGKDYHVVFSQPHRRMVYPFTFGDYYSASLSGYGVYPENTTTDIAGDYDFEADAYGTLILPNDVLNNVLRVKTNLARYEFARCYFSETQQVKYLYYVENQRYPVFSILETMWINYKGDTTWHRSAAVNQSVYNVNDEKPDEKPALTARKEYVHNVFPNPFHNEFEVNFVLEEKTNVAVELYSMEGIKLYDICSKHLLEQGFHEYEYKNSALPTGMYFVKFIFNDVAFVKQVIKIK